MPDNVSKIRVQHMMSVEMTQAMIVVTMQGVLESPD
jgi:hypothetical protein